MITAITADPLSTGSIGLSDFRSRPVIGERTLLQDSTPAAPKNSGAASDGFLPRHEPPAQPTLEPDPYGAASMFAAAVIAGAMPPAPTSVEQVIMRIGSIPLPPETEARLKDLIA